MSDLADDNTEDMIFSQDISDEALEAAACVKNAAAYTQIAFCSMGVCPGG